MKTIFHSKPHRVEAAMWTLVLGALFFFIYGTSNWITSLRHDVGTFYFNWETWIPFVPVMIIPYMSIDLFFAGAPFLCRNRDDLHTLVTRMFFTIGISVICFLLFPLKFTFTRPEVSGWLGAIFAPLNTFDHPFNLAPSLHISLRSILWPVYAKRLNQQWRSVLKIWFGLIGVSTLLVYQHHIVDIIAGNIVALLAFYLIPEKNALNEHAALAKNVKMAWIYSFAAIMGAVLTVATDRFSLVFLWITVAMAILAGAYLRLGSHIFQKSNGQLPFHTRLFLAPYLLGARLSFLFYTRSEPAWGRVTENIFVGRKLSNQEADELRCGGITAVLDLTAEYSESKTLRRLVYKNIPVLDLTIPTNAQISEAITFIREHSKTGKVYIHCALGYSRSVLVAAAYLLAEGVAETEAEAVGMVRRARPHLVLTASALQVLKAFRQEPIEPRSSLPIFHGEHSNECAFSKIS